MIKLVFFCALVAVSLARPQFGRPPIPFQRSQALGDPRLAAILRLSSEIFPDGRYHYSYETENGISAEEGGEQKPAGNFVGTNAQGNYRYTSPEGVPVHIEYTADENGYHPSGDLLPTPPPIPEAILRSIEYIAANSQNRGSSLPSSRNSPFTRF